MALLFGLGKLLEGREACLVGLSQFQAWIPVTSTIPLPSGPEVDWTVLSPFARDQKPV